MPIPASLATGAKYGPEVSTGATATETAVLRIPTSLLDLEAVTLLSLSHCCVENQLFQKAYHILSHIRV